MNNLSELIPKGFYHHYKHDPSKGFNDHAYEVVGIGMHSEDLGLMVLYRPLYESSILKDSIAKCWIRPYEMFIGMVEKEGKTVPRFQKIEDREVIEKLKTIKDETYPELDK